MALTNNYITCLIRCSVQLGISISKQEDREQETASCCGEELSKFYFSQR